MRDQLIKTLEGALDQLAVAPLKTMTFIDVKARVDNALYLLQCAGEPVGQYVHIYNGIMTAVALQEELE